MNAFLNFNMHPLVANCGCLHMLWGVAVINRHDEKEEKIIISKHQIICRFSRYFIFMHKASQSLAEQRDTSSTFFFPGVGKNHQWCHQIKKYSIFLFKTHKKRAVRMVFTAFTTKENNPRTEFMCFIYGFELLKILFCDWWTRASRGRCCSGGEKIWWRGWGWLVSGGVLV